MSIWGITLYAICFGKLLHTILSFAMFLKLSLKNNKVSELIESSVENVLGKGYRTKDIMQSGKNLVTTSDMGSLISEEIKNLSISF